MAEIKIHDLGALQDYSTSIHNFVKEYESAIEGTRHNFNLKVEGAQAEAIEAFFRKLEELQSTVFDRFPEVLTNCATVVETYHDHITSLGFSKKAYSSDLDAEAVASVLNGNQLDAVTDITSQLRNAFQLAAEAMGVEEERVDSIEQVAESSLMEAGDERKRLDAQMQDAFAIFKRGDLAIQIEELDALNAAVNTVDYVTHIPVSIVFQAIGKGYLTAGEMYYFDGLQSKEDTKVLQALLSRDITHIKEMLKQDSTKVSDGVFLALTNEMMQWIEEKDLTTLNAFVDGMSSNLYSVNQYWLLKLQSASITLASTTTTAMQALYDLNPENLHTPQMQTYERYLSQLNSYLGFVETLYVLGIGLSTESFPSTQTTGFLTHRQVSTKVSLTITAITHSGITFHRTKETTTTVMENHSDNPYHQLTQSNIVVEKENYVSQLYSTSVGVAIADHQGRIAELQKARQKASKEALQNLAKTLFTV